MNSATKLRSMRGLMAGAGLKEPQVARAPKVPAVPKPPKLARMTLQPVGNTGAVRATHHYTGAPTKNFTFKKPEDLSAHIKKVQSSEWLHPNVQRSAGKVDRLMDIG